MQCRNRLGLKLGTVIMPLFAMLVFLTPGAGAASPSGSGPGTGPDFSPGASAVSVYGGLPLHFTPNRGQAAPEVKFYHQGPNQGIYCTRQGLWFRFSPPGGKETEQRARAKRADRTRRITTVRLTPLHLNKGMTLAPVDPQAGKVNYFLGNQPEKWRVNLPTYGAVVYREAYPGIDLKFYGQGRQLEYDVVVRPGADLKRVRFKYQGVAALQLTPQGDLAIRLPDGGTLIQKKPVVYQEIAGQRVAREGKFQLYPGAAAHVFGFTVASYDRSRPLIIDPVLVYSTYLGGSGEEAGKGLTVDAEGKVYVTGWTGSLDFPTTPGVYQEQHMGPANVDDAYVAKFSPSGALVFATYLGGTADDGASGVTLEGNGNIYLVGDTESTDFPTTEGAVQRTYRGGGDAFVAKLTPNGDLLLFSTYLGGSGFEEVESTLAVDEEGNAYVTGETGSNDFPVTPGAFQSKPGGGMDGFVAKISHMGTALIFSTYLGGSANDRGHGLALDAGGNAYIAGETKSSDFPTSSNPFQKEFHGNQDAFVAKFSPTGALIYSSFLGCDDEDGGRAIAVDASGCAYVTGFTRSAKFPTTSDAFQKIRGPLSDAFVTKVNSEGTAIVYSTFLGGDGEDMGQAIAVDSRGNAYIAGTTDSKTFPVLRAFQATRGGATDAFVAKLNPWGSSLLFSTYLGGAGEEQGEGIALGPRGLVYVSGRTASGNFPVENPYQANLKGTLDAFVVKMQENDPAVAVTTLLLLEN